MRRQTRDERVRAEAALAQRLYVARRRAGQAAAARDGQLVPLTRSIADDMIAITRTVLRDVRWGCICGWGWSNDGAGARALLLG